MQGTPSPSGGRVSIECREPSSPGAFAPAPRPDRCVEDRSARLLAVGLSALLIAPLLLVQAPVARAIDDTATIAPGVWSGSGPGGTTATTVRNGTGGLAEFAYARNLGIAGGVPLTQWDFVTTAATAGTAHMDWTLAGLHAWFQVTVGLTVIRNGTAVEPLVTAGPTSCCTEPSNGFAYDGSASVLVEAGDSFGFRISGSNGDSNSFLQGTLRVGINGIKNGSFETPVVVPPDGFKTLPTQLAALPEWTLGPGEIQLVNDTYWNAADGDQSLDLNGETSTGSLSQTIATVPGQAYRIAFQYSANPESSDPTPGMAVLVDGAQAGPTFSHPRDTPSVEVPHTITWQPGTVAFTASGSSTTITFDSTDPVESLFGIALDDVIVRPDPVGLASGRRRQRAVPVSRRADRLGHRCGRCRGRDRPGHDRRPALLDERLVHRRRPAWRPDAPARRGPGGDRR